MATQINVFETTQFTISKSNLSWIKRYALRRFHPRAILIDMVGMIWFTYFFWYHDWRMALMSIVFFRVAAIATAMNIDLDAFAQSKLGKLALLHLNPFNFVTQVVGVVVLLFGIWQHSVEYTLGGISILLFGHVVGWSTIDQLLADRNSSAA